MPIKSWLRALFGDADWLYQTASQLNLTNSAKQCRAVAARLGAKVAFRASGTVVDFGRESVLFSTHERPLIISCRLENWAYFKTRLVFETGTDGRPVSDCRLPARYRLPCGKFVMLPTPPEPADFLAGYFAKGSPKTGDVVVDIGAFCGETTLELATRVGPSGKVYALEPDAANLVLLRQNIREAGLTNVEVIPAVLWSTTGKVEFIADGNGGSSLASIAGTPASVSSAVDAISPSDLLRSIGRIPDFIKMDIEGAEVEVLQAMMPLIEDRPIRFAIASYHIRQGQRTAEIITPLLESAGLEVETGNPEHLTTWAWRT